MKFWNWLINALFPGYLATHQAPKEETPAAPPKPQSVTTPPPQAASAPSPSSPGSQSPTGGTIVKGLDVSHYEPVMDYHKAFSQGFRFVYAKATDGDSGVDAKYGYHLINAKAAGLIFGAFCFNRFDADPVKQAVHHMSVVAKIIPGELPPCLDVEWDRYAKNSKYHDGGKIDDAGAEHCLITLKELEKLSGMIPVWYTHHYFFQGVSRSLVQEFARYPLWLTQPGAAAPTTIPGLPKITFWQNTFHVPGLASQNPDGIDGDVFFGSLDDLKALCKP